jgi:hypothetical protein
LKSGDLVLLRGTRFSSWPHLNEIGTVVSNDHFAEGLLVMFSDGEIKDFAGYEDHFEVVSEK